MSDLARRRLSIFGRRAEGTSNQNENSLVIIPNTKLLYDAAFKYDAEVLVLKVPKDSQPTLIRDLHSIDQSHGYAFPICAIFIPPLYHAFQLMPFACSLRQHTTSARHAFVSSSPPPSTPSLYRNFLLTSSPLLEGSAKFSAPFGIR